MKPIDKNSISTRNFNEFYSELTAEELIEKYKQLFLSDQRSDERKYVLTKRTSKGLPLPKRKLGQTKRPGKKQIVRKAGKRPKGLSRDEKEHLNKRHKRHKRDRYSPEQTMEGVDSDYDFIQGLRVSRKRGKPSKTCEVW
jgi:hypothetical protein